MALPITSKTGSNFVGFRWQLDNWQPGVLHQCPIHFGDGSKYLLKNHQPIDSTRFELLFRSIDAVSSDKVWYMEAIIPHAFDSQKSVVVYSPLVVSPPYPEAHFLTPVPLSDIDNFLFQNSTLYVDLRISDEPFPSSGIPAGSGSSLPRAPLPYAGLQNIGWSSYVNGVVQALFHLPVFRSVVYSLSDAAGVVRELQRLFGGLEIPAKVSSARLLLRAFGWSQTDVLMRHDASDFVRLLLSKLSEIAADGRVSDLFAVKFAALPPQFGLSLDIRQAGSLDEALARALAPAAVSAFPPLLVVHLQRFELNALTGKREKITDFLIFPELLNVARYSAAAAHAYELVSVQVHAGPAPSGTYVAFVRPTGDEWLQFHDAAVTPASRDQAVFQNFGQTSAASAFMLIYGRRDSLGDIFRAAAMPQRIRDFISPVEVRAHPRRERDAARKVLRIFTDADIREAFLDARPLAACADAAAELAVDDEWSNRDLYARISGMLARTVDLLKIWRVGADGVPTLPVPDNLQRFPRRDALLFVQELSEPQLFIERDMRLALVSFFFPHATPRVQYLGTVTVVATQPISQLCPAIWGMLGIPGTLFNIYCEQMPQQPLSHAIPLVDLGITECASYIAEAIVPMQTAYQPSFRKQKQEDVVSYYSMVRPTGDMNVAQYLERKAPQLRIFLRSVTNADAVQTVVAAPEGLPVTELPDLVLFATKEPFESARDTIQLFRRRVDGDLNEVMPYVLKPDTTIKHLFSAEIRKDDDLILFYDVIRGILPDQLKTMVVRTCELYDTPTHCKQRIRFPMRPNDPLGLLTRYIQENVYPCASARLLLNADGSVRLIAQSDPPPEESAILRFEEIPADHAQMGDGEFLVTAVVCRAQGVENCVPVGISFLFKVIPGEVMDRTRRRIAGYAYADENVIPWVSFQARKRFLNDDERLDTFIGPGELLRIVLPDKARSNAIIRGSRKSGRKKGE